MAEQDDGSQSANFPSGAGTRHGNSRVGLCAPWDDELQSARESSQFMDTDSPEFLNGFVNERTRVHELYIREQARNKRIGLILAFFLILAAALIVMFAPEGKQTMSYWVGSALLIFAAGASGFERIWGKTKNICFGADKDKRGRQRMTKHV